MFEGNRYVGRKEEVANYYQLRAQLASSPEKASQDDWIMENPDIVEEWFFRLQYLMAIKNLEDTGRSQAGVVLAPAVRAK